ncbi:C1 family peptidase [Patescibacteria group bacterium]
MKIIICLFVYFPILMMFACGPGSIELDAEDRCHPSIPGEFEENFSWDCADTDEDGIGENYLSSIKQQSAGNCYIFSAVAAIEIQAQINHKRDVGEIAEINLSEEAVHVCFRMAKDLGGDPISIFRIANTYGLVEETDFQTECPYFKKQPEYLRVFKIGDYERLWKTGSIDVYDNRRQKLIRALQHGPVVVLFSHWGAFIKEEDGIRRCNPDDLKERGAHAIVAVGYKNYGERILFKNSGGGSELLKIRFDQFAIDECGFFRSATQAKPYEMYDTFIETPFPEYDMDKDTVPDEFDNCPMKSNIGQEDADGDMFGDACDHCVEEAGEDGFTCPFESHH